MLWTRTLADSPERVRYSHLSLSLCWRTGRKGREMKGGGKKRAPGEVAHTNGMLAITDRVGENSDLPARAYHRLNLDAVGRDDDGTDGKRDGRSDGGKGRDGREVLLKAFYVRTIACSRCQMVVHNKTSVAKK